MKGKTKIYNCGDIILVKKSITAKPCNRAKTRAKRQQKTTAAQRAVNQQNASEKLFALLQTNFRGGDLHIITTYAPERYPDNVENIKRNQYNFVRRLEYAYKKHEKKLKYIQVTEYSKSRIHHHYIINSVEGVSLADIQKIWGKGFVRCTALEDNGYYKDLSDYLIKETSTTFSSDTRVYGKRWTASRNLTPPEVITTTEQIKNKTEYLTAPQVYKSFELIKGSEYKGINEYTGGSYIIYAMRKRRE